MLEYVLGRTVLAFCDPVGVLMITVKVIEKGSGKGARGQQVVLSYDGEQGTLVEQFTNRNGVAYFNAQPGSGKVLVNGVERRNCYIDWCTEIALWSVR